MSHRVRVLSLLGAAFVRALGATWRIRSVNEDRYAQERVAGRSSVLVLWHGTMLPLLYYHRGRPIAILISEHSDGEIIARIARSFRFPLVRGSTSRGAARALVALQRVLADGGDVAVTPDGPRGPFRSVAPGALIAAQRAGASIVPLGVSVDRAWQLKSWDRFLIPKPFARITIAYGSPGPVPATNAREAASTGEWLTGRMEAAERVASQG